jgi:hypothetical protein
MPTRTKPPRPESESPPDGHRVQHVVYLREGPDAGFVGWSRRAWTFKTAAPPAEPVVASVIRAWGDDVRVLEYGSEDPDVRRRVDEVVRRIKGGWRFASGPTGQIEKQHPKTEKIREFVFGLLFILTGNPPPKFFPGSSSRPPTWEQPGAATLSERRTSPGGRYLKAEWMPIPLGQSQWERLYAAHDPVLEDDRDKRLDEITDALATSYPPLVARAPARNRKRLREIIGKRSGVRGDATRFAFESAEALVITITAETFNCSEKTVRRAAAHLLKSFSTPPATPHPPRS